MNEVLKMLWDAMQSSTVQWAALAGSTPFVAIAARKLVLVGVDRVRTIKTRCVLALDSIEALDKRIGTNGDETVMQTLHGLQAEQRRQGAIQDAMMHAFDAPMFRTDADGDFETVNRPLEELTGYTEDEMKGRGWITALADESRAAVVADWDHAIRDRRIFERIVVFRYRPRDPKSLTEYRMTDVKFEARVTAHPIRDKDEDAPVEGWYGVVRVLSAHRRISDREQTGLNGGQTA